MITASWRQLCIILCVITFARVTPAQDLIYHVGQTDGGAGVTGRTADVGTNELGMWAGYSGDNPTLVGRSKNRTFFELNLRYARVLETGDSWALKYSAEIVPVANVRQPRQGVRNGNPVDLPGNKQKIYGFGFTPVGLQMNLRRGHVLQPYINGTVGVLYFREQVPVTDSSKFNFTLGLGAGAQIWYRENQSIQLGYKYHHISNGYTASRNPGVDSNLFYLGYTVSWRP